MSIRTLIVASWYRTSTLAATSLGLGSVVYALADYVFNNEDCKKKVIPKRYAFAISVLIGFPANLD